MRSAAGARHHGDFEQPVLDAIAAVAGIAGKEQHLVGVELYRRRAGEQICRKMFAASPTAGLDWYAVVA